MHAHELEQALVPQDGETLVFDTNPVLNERVTHYCPGCHHGIAHRLVSEVLHELGVADRTILVASVGCATFTYDYFNVDGLESVVFTYQGDGDMGAIGLAESIHAANRGELITGIFINNTVYGMTGGQMAPTTLLGQKTTTSPRGRDMARHEGGPIRMAELMAQLSGVAYSERCALDSVKHVRAAKKALRKAFEVQLQGLGFGFVELLSGCPTNWHMDPVSANKRISEAMIPVFPLGVYKDVTAPAESEVQHG